MIIVDRTTEALALGGFIIGLSALDDGMDNSNRRRRGVIEANALQLTTASSTDEEPFDSNHRPIRGPVEFRETVWRES